MEYHEENEPSHIEGDEQRLEDDDQEQLAHEHQEDPELDENQPEENEENALREDGSDREERPSGEFKPDETTNTFICPKHQLPIRGVCLDAQTPHKTVCARCFKEIPEDLLKYYLDLDDFLAKGKKFDFSDKIPGLERDAQKNQGLLKDFMGSIDIIFEQFSQQITVLREKLKDNLKRRFELENDILFKLISTNIRMNSLITQLRSTPNSNSLAQTVTDHIEITKMVALQARADGSKFSHFVSEKIKQCSLQFDLCKNLLDKVVLAEDIHYHSMQHTMQRSSLELTSLSASPLPPVKSAVTLKHAQASKLSLHEVNKAFIDSYPLIPLRGERGEKVTKQKAPGNKERLRNLRDSMVTWFETVDTRLKCIDSLEFLPEHNLLVLGGSIKGDQFHKILYMKLAPEISAFKMVNAHSNIITNIVAGSKILLSSSKDRLIRAWDLVTFEILFALRHTNPVLGMVFDEPQGRVYSFGDFVDIRVWDSNTRKELKPLKVPTDNIVQIAMVTLSKDPQKKYIAAACQKSDRIFVVDIERNRVVLKIDEHIPIGNCDLKFVKDQNLLINTSIGGNVRVWSLSKQEPNLIAEPVNFNLENSPFPIVNMTVGDQDGLILLANGTREIMVTSFKELSLKALLKLDEEEAVQHSRMLYLSDKKILYTIDKFSGRLTVMNLRNASSYAEKGDVSIDMSQNWGRGSMYSIDHSRFENNKSVLSKK